MAMEKGGCKTGRVGEPKGGCKVGKKKKIVIRRKKKVDENSAKKTASSTMIKPAPKRVRKITIKERVVAPAPNNVSFKTKDNKTVSFTTAPKKIKIRVKKSTAKLMEEWKSFRMPLKPEGMMKKLGRKFGRLPNLTGRNEEGGRFSAFAGRNLPTSYKLSDTEMLNILVDKWGPRFEEFLREELLEKIAKKKAIIAKKKK